MEKIDSKFGMNSLRLWLRHSRAPIKHLRMSDLEDLGIDTEGKDNGFYLCAINVIERLGYMSIVQNDRSIKIFTHKYPEIYDNASKESLNPRFVQIYFARKDLKPFSLIREEFCSMLNIEDYETRHLKKLNRMLVKLQIPLRGVSVKNQHGRVSTINFMSDMTHISDVVPTSKPARPEVISTKTPDVPLESVKFIDDTFKKIFKSGPEYEVEGDKIIVGNITFDASRYLVTPLYCGEDSTQFILRQGDVLKVVIFEKDYDEVSVRYVKLKSDQKVVYNNKSKKAWIEETNDDGTLHVRDKL